MSTPGKAKGGHTLASGVTSDDVEVSFREPPLGTLIHSASSSPTTCDDFSDESPVGSASPDDFASQLSAMAACRGVGLVSPPQPPQLALTRSLSSRARVDPLDMAAARPPRSSWEGGRHRNRHAVVHPTQPSQIGEVVHEAQRRWLHRVAVWGVDTHVPAPASLADSSLAEQPRTAHFSAQTWLARRLHGTQGDDDVASRASKNEFE